MTEATAKLEPNFAESVLWSLHNAVLVIDTAHTVRYANRAALRLLSEDGATLDDRDIFELLDHPPDLAPAITAALESHQVSRFQCALQRSEESLEMSVTVSSDSATPQRLNLSIDDVTHVALLEDRARQVERIAAAERLVGGFAHQIRNPLAAISALVENLVAETSRDDPRIEYTSRLLNQVMRMERLIRACLTFSSAPSAMRTRVAPEHIGNATVTLFEARHDVVPRIVVEDELHDVIVSEEQITQCLCFLLERAMDVCRDIDKIELRIASRSATGHAPLVLFTVRDEGPCLDDGDRRMVFEPFFTHKARGLGMGLATAQALAVQNGGAIDVRSTADNTQFTLRLEAAAPLEADPRPATSTSTVSAH